MSKTHGKSGHLGLGDSGDAIVDISTWLNNVERSLSRDIAESTGFKPSGNLKTYVAGLKDGTLSIAGQYDGDANAIDEILAAAYDTDVPRSWEFGPGGNGSGALKYSGGPNGGGSAGEGALMTSYNITTPLDGVVNFTAEFQITGQQVRGTFA